MLYKANVVAIFSVKLTAVVIKINAKNVQSVMRKTTKQRFQ